MNYNIERQNIIDYATKELNFDLISFAKAEPLYDDNERLKEWLKMGFQAGMSWLENNIEKRTNPEEIFKNAKSIIVLAKNYYHNESHSTQPNTAKISRYAWGRDYHKVLKSKLKKFDIFLKSNYENCDTKYYTDTGPIMEKSWAVRSGLGWLGKHTNVISREIGSWFFLSVIITNIEFDEYGLPIEDFCGECTACIDACPTDAIVQPYLLDSNKCISYLTIEQNHQTEIPKELSQNLNNWVFGCDICQDVCPWNKFKKQTNEPDFFPRGNVSKITFEELDKMTELEFNTRFEGSAIRRTKYEGMKKNLRANLIKN